MTDDEPRGTDGEVTDDEPRGTGGEVGDDGPRGATEPGEAGGNPEPHPDDQRVTGGGDPEAAPDEVAPSAASGEAAAASETADVGDANDDDAITGDATGHDRPTTVIARTVTRVVVPVIVVTAIALLLQGHNLPGGGFIGAVLTATAFVLVYVIFGLTYLEQELLHQSPITSDREGMAGAYRWLFSVGLAVAAGAGIVPMAFGEPFLTQGVLVLDHPLGPIPLFEEFEVASAFAFDLGVYFAVVGGLLTIVEVVGRE